MTSAGDIPGSRAFSGKSVLDKSPYSAAECAPAPRVAQQRLTSPKAIAYD